MADEAVNPAPREEHERRWGESGYAGEWVRAADTGVGTRARWIDDDRESPPRPADRQEGGDRPAA